jgi:hypothetical protein
MAGAAQVLDWFREGALLRPDPAVANTVDLGRAIARASGATLPPTEGDERVSRVLGETDHLVFVLVDGLGLELVERLPATSFLRRHQRLPLRAVFPSATASALTSLATGLWPGHHGIPGWWTYLPEQDLTATTLPFVERWSGQALDALGVDVRALFPAPPLLPGFARDAASFLPRAIADSAYSRWVRGASPTLPYDEVPAAVDAILARVAGARGPTYTYFYMSMVDALSHTHGPLAPEVMAQVLALDPELERLAGGLAGRGRLVLSADHGLQTIEEDAKHVLRAGDPLAGLLLAPPSGEPRAPILHARPGQKDRVRGLFEARFGDVFTLLDVDEAAALELFGPGPLGPVTRERLGDFVALSRGPHVLLYRPGEEPTGTERLRGYHGGLLPAEVLVPLVVA